MASDHIDRARRRARASLDRPPVAVYPEPGKNGDGDTHDDEPPIEAGATAPAFMKGDAWEEPPARPQSACPGPRFTFLNSADFARADYRLEWFIKRLLVKRQPAILGGPRKSLKTSVAVDLALSLGAAVPFLGTFEVPQRVRVALLSGESGEGVLQETARRVSAAKGIDLADADVLWGFQLPQLSNLEHMAHLRTALQDAGAQVVVIDPLYLCLLGGSDLQASNMMQMGPLFMSVAQTCLSVGCTPILAHHFRQTRANPHSEPQLEDLAFSGCQEFARQWLLLGRREKYEPGTGDHRLWLSAGGSAGQSGLWAVEVSEGVTGDDFTGRHWTVSVRAGSEVRQAAADEREAGRREQQQKDDQALATAIDQLTARGEYVTASGKPAAGYTAARDLANLSGRRMIPAVERLISAGIARKVQVTVRAGSGHRKVEGLERVEGES